MVINISIGTSGHVEHGKTSLIAALTGKSTLAHSEELKRGITIRLGYAFASIYKCPECKDFEAYKLTPKCLKHNIDCEKIMNISFVDAPGHETLMTTMISGASIMDGAMLVIAANEPCPQPQTREHLKALEIVGIKNIIIVQNKIDLVTEEQAKENYLQIKKFVKGTVAENAPIIPISAHQGANIDVLVSAIVEYFKPVHKDEKADPVFLIARSFDINRPGTEIKSLNGGVFGGA